MEFWGAVVALLLAICALVRGDTYTVTSTNCQGSGSFTEAIQFANAHPGLDTITFTPGLVIDGSSCDEASLGNRGYAAKVTDSLIIEGNGVYFKGAIQWISPSGGLNNLNKCPDPSKPLPYADIILAISPNFLRVIGGIDVTVRNMTLFQFAGIVYVKGPSATVTFEDFEAKEIYAVPDCNANAVTVEGSEIRFIRNQWYLVVFWDILTISSTIIGSGVLYIEDSFFYRMLHSYFIDWSGSIHYPGLSSLNIVSTQMIRTGGIIAGHDVAETNIVNSAWAVEYAVTSADIYFRIRNIGTAGPMNIIASTFYFGLGIGCDYQCDPSLEGGIVGEGTAGPINFKSSAIGMALPENSQYPVLKSYNGGSFTADIYTWIQPDVVQDANALRILTNQPGLLTEPPGLRVLDLFASAVQQWTPLLGNSTSPGVLIDAVPSATTTNLLVNPVTGLPITKDVLGNPRTDSNDKRNIGAVQLTLAPALSLLIIGNETALLAWTRPLDPPSGNITGYYVFSRPSGAGAWTLAADVTNPAKLDQSITGLVDGQSYEFYVAAYNQVGAGPPSNIVSGTPYGPIGSPQPTVVSPPGKLWVTWPPVTDVGGRTLAGYLFIYTCGNEILSIEFTTSTQVALTGLPPLTGCTVCVYAFATDGTNSEPGCTTATTSSCFLRLKTRTSRKFARPDKTVKYTLSLKNLDKNYAYTDLGVTFHISSNVGTFVKVARGWALGGWRAKATPTPLVTSSSITWTNLTLNPRERRRLKAVVRINANATQGAQMSIYATTFPCLMATANSTVTVK